MMYYFWPRNDTWDQINIELRSKPWINERERTITLNEITQVMNQWRLNKEIKKTNIKLYIMGTS